MRMGVARCGDRKQREEKKRRREEVVKMRGERVGEGIWLKDVR